MMISLLQDTNQEVCIHATFMGFVDLKASASGSVYDTDELRDMLTIMTE
jgi:hypothetical protein